MSRYARREVDRMVASTLLRPPPPGPVADPAATARFSLLHVATLPADVRESRHRLLIAVLALHVPALLLLGYAHDSQVREAGLLALPLLAAVLGARFGTVRMLRSVSVVLGLAWSSYATVHLAGGAPEAHLQPLLVIALVALYQDPGLLLLGVLAETAALVVPATLAPDLVFAPGAALRRPGIWAVVHAVALLGVAAAVALAWRRDVPVPVFAEPPTAAHPQVALPEPAPIRELDAEHLQRARAAELALAQRQTTYALMTNLARRNQSLIGRQLSTLDELERDERDPDVLAGLFALDHLATRMRRNAENLLVLAGAPATGRGFAQPVAVDELLRGAAAEVEQYARVDVSVGTDSAVAGHVVSDVAHLLAELLDNALACSPPDTRVTVGAAPAASGGLRLWVSDDGIGMTAARLAEHNAALMHADGGEPEMGATLGFPVVKRLASRHKIVVTLGARDGGKGGLVAYVDVPAAVVVGLAPVLVDLPSPAATALPGRRTARRIPVGADRSRRNELARGGRDEADSWFAPAPMPAEPGHGEEVAAVWDTDDAADAAAVPPSVAASGLPVRGRRTEPAVSADAMPPTAAAHARPVISAPDRTQLADAILFGALPTPRRPPIVGALDTALAPAPELSAAVSAWTAPDLTVPAPAGSTVVPATSGLPPLARRVPQQALREAGGTTTFEPGPALAPSAATGAAGGAGPDPAGAQSLLSAYRAGLTQARTRSDDPKEDTV